MLKDRISDGKDMELSGREESKAEENRALGRWSNTREGIVPGAPCAWSHTRRIF